MMQELGSAIGWLAREDKIQFELEHHQSKDTKALIYLMLNSIFLKWLHSSGGGIDFVTQSNINKEREIWKFDGTKKK